MRIYTKVVNRAQKEPEFERKGVDLCCDTKGIDYSLVIQL